MNRIKNELYKKWMYKKIMYKNWTYKKWNYKKWTYKKLTYKERTYKKKNWSLLGEYISVFKITTFFNLLAMILATYLRKITVIIY